MTHVLPQNHVSRHDPVMQREATPEVSGNEALPPRLTPPNGQPAQPNGTKFDELYHRVLQVCCAALGSFSAFMFLWLKQVFFFLLLFSQRALSSLDKTKDVKISFHFVVFSHGQTSHTKVVISQLNNSVQPRNDICYFTHQLLCLHLK